MDTCYSSLQAFSAGVGNWVADEVLYQAKLYPEVKANSLTDDEIQRLHEAIKQVPAAAVEAEADSEKFPPDWLFHVRWDGKKKNPKINGNAVEFLKVGGRVRCASFACKPGHMLSMFCQADCSCLDSYTHAFAEIKLYVLHL